MLEDRYGFTPIADILICGGKRGDWFDSIFTVSLQDQLIVKTKRLQYMRL